MRPKLPRHLPRPIGTDDLNRALLAADPRMRAWLTLAAYAGLRCVEIAGLRAEDVHLDREPPVLHLVKTKGAKERIVPLGPLVSAALRGYGLPLSGPVFTRDRGPRSRYSLHP